MSMAPAKSTQITVTSPTTEPVRAAAGRRWLAVTRIALGFVFLWAFLDKTFGLGYSTPSARAWIHGGSPTSGFLSHVSVGPFRGFFASLAGSALLDVLFQLAMLGIGLALILGIGLRVAAAVTTFLMGLMWAAEWPLARTTFDGQPSGSTNPVVDYHIIYALLAIVCALLSAGRTWGLGRWWERLPLVQRLPWLK